MSLDDLRAATKTLHDRVAREIKRLGDDTVGPTEMVGGWARVGAALDQFMRVAFVSACENTGRDAHAEFKRITRGAYEFERGTAGQFAHAFASLALDDDARPRAIAILARDVATKDSVIGAVIELRNALVHSRREPTPHEAMPVLVALDELLGTIRSHDAL